MLVSLTAVVTNCCHCLTSSALVVHPTHCACFSHSCCHKLLSLPHKLWWSTQHIVLVSLTAVVTNCCHSLTSSGGPPNTLCLFHSLLLSQVVVTDTSLDAKCAGFFNSNCEFLKEHFKGRVWWKIESVETRV